MVLRCLTLEKGLESSLLGHLYGSRSASFSKANKGWRICALGYQPHMKSCIRYLISIFSLFSLEIASACPILSGGDGL